MSTNSHRIKAQHRKATLIAYVLAGHGATAAQVSVLPDEGKRNAEALAGVPLSSEDTWALVEAILTSQEAARAHEVARLIRDEEWDKPGAGALRVA